MDDPATFTIIGLMLAWIMFSASIRDTRRINRLDRRQP